MSVFQEIKNILKYIFPPPTKSFMREINDLRRHLFDIREELSVIRKENEAIRDELNQVLTELRDSSWDNYKSGHWTQNYAYLSSIPEERYPEELCKWYYQQTGDILNLANPRTLNEKIQWMKLYDATPLKTRLADKYLVREWVKEKIGEEYLIPLLGAWDHFDEINFDEFPDRFVLKANHGSGWNIIVKNKATFDREDAKRKFEEWMNLNYSFCNGYELQYMNIPPKIIAEEYIENEKGLKDYSIFCFNGKPTQVWVDLYCGTPNYLRSVYDMDWNPLPLKCTWPDGGELLSERPKSFETMKEFAALLSQDFAFVRVDFYDVNGKLYMGEMTFTPMSGLGRFEPAQWNRELGKLLILPPKSPIPKRLY